MPALATVVTSLRAVTGSERLRQSQHASVRIILSRETTTGQGETGSRDKNSLHLCVQPQWRFD